MPLEMKLAWEFIWAHCDNAGVWTPNTKLAEFQIGKKVDWDSFLTRCGDRVVKLPNGRWYLTEFVKFQCGELSEKSRPHVVVIGLLRKHGLMKPDSLTIEYQNSTCRVLETYKDKEEDKDRDKDQDNAHATANKARGTEAELVAFCVEIGLPKSDGETLFEKWTGNGWKVGNAPIKDWRATVRSWRRQGYLPSQKNGSASHRRASEYPETLNIPDLTPDATDPSQH